MGIFDLFSKRSKRARYEKALRSYGEARRRQTNAHPIKLVEPSVGNVVEFEVTEQRDFLASLYMEQLITFVECFERFGAQGEVTERTVRLTFDDSYMAEAVRQGWKR